jgi:hypothetical protein
VYDVTNRFVGSIAKATRVAKAEGPALVAARGLRRLAGRLSPLEHPFPLFLDDVVTDLKSLPGPMPGRRLNADQPLTINWVMSPPSPGSGGHTTMLRIVEFLEAQGHECRLYLYDRYLGDHLEHEKVIRGYWPGLRSGVFDARQGMAPADAVFASGWATAHLVANSSAPGRRFYLVQDFEPSFHPVSSEQVLAELTYRFGFHGITAGRWLAQRLSAEYGMVCDWFDFGCDCEIYRVTNHEQRTGVVFYAKPDVPRRAYILGTLALRAFAERHPEIDIHLYGNESVRLPFRVIDHGRLTPAELNTLYNRCAAGLSLSLTNVSLVPWEMLASGCVPVVNEAEHNRLVLRDAPVEYAALAPQAVADALCRLVEHPDHGRRARDVSSSMARASWDDAGRLVESVLKRELCE